jgi:hypothetical protein
MRRIGFILLAMCAVLAAGGAAGGLARAASVAAIEHLGPLQPAATATPTPSYWVYLPLVVRVSGVGAWSAVVEEGFETAPGSLWESWNFGGYQWAWRNCRSHTGSQSAWAIGGGTGGGTLACFSDCPDNVDAWMAYGPFSLADATAAELSFYVRLNVGTDPNDGLWVCYSLDGDQYWCRQLTYEPTDWGSLTFPLDNALIGFDLRLTSPVWIAVEYVNSGTVTVPEGAYVDDFVIRKCTGGLCEMAVSSGADLPAVGLRKVQRVRSSEERRIPVQHSKQPRSGP